MGLRDTSKSSMNRGKPRQPSKTRRGQRHSQADLRVERHHTDGQGQLGFSSPPQLRAQHYNKERILNTTFQQQKFQGFEQRAKQKERQNDQNVQQSLQE